MQTTLSYQIPQLKRSCTQVEQAMLSGGLPQTSMEEGRKITGVLACEHTYVYTSVTQVVKCQPRNLVVMGSNPVPGSYSVLYFSDTGCTYNHVYRMLLTQHYLNTVIDLLIVTGQQHFNDFFSTFFHL